MKKILTMDVIIGTLTIIMLGLIISCIIFLIKFAHHDTSSSGYDSRSRTVNVKEKGYNTVLLENCEYLLDDYNGQFSHKGNCPNLIHQTDTVYIYGVSIRYGTRDTIFKIYPIDSAEVAVGYLRSNGALSK